MLIQLKERKGLRRKSDRCLRIHPDSLKLSDDVMRMAQTISSEWGLKTPIDAVEAVFRKYANEYMYGRQNPRASVDFMDLEMPARDLQIKQQKGNSAQYNDAQYDDVQCEAMSELDGLLGL